MSLREAGRTYRSAASGGFSLTAPPNESWRVRYIFCVPSTNDTYVTVAVGGRTVNKIRVKGKAGNHLPYPAVVTAYAYEAALGTIFDQMKRVGVDLSIPVATGETLTISRYAEAGDVTIVYDAYDAADVSATEPNGSRSLVLNYLKYMTNTSALTATPASLATDYIWTSGEPWPVSGAVVPDNTQIDVLAIGGAPGAQGNGSGANKGYTTYLQMLRGGAVLFDPQGVGNGYGLPFVGDISVTATTCSYKAIASLVGPGTAEQPEPLFVPPAPLAFQQGERLTVQVVLADAAASGLLATVLDVFLVLRRTTKGG